MAERSEEVEEGTPLKERGSGEDASGGAKDERAKRSSLVSLNLSNGGAKPPPPPPSPLDRNGKALSPGEPPQDAASDAADSERLRELEELKKVAVQAEDYREAARLKGQIAELRAYSASKPSGREGEAPAMAKLRHGAPMPVEQSSVMAELAKRQERKVGPLGLVSTGL